MDGRERFTMAEGFQISSGRRKQYGFTSTLLFPPSPTQALAEKGRKGRERTDAVEWAELKSGGFQPLAYVSMG